MSSVRTIIGISVGSGLEGVDAALLRVDGIGLSARAHVLKSSRVQFPATLHEALRQKNASPRTVGETLTSAARKIAGDSRDAFCIGLMTPGGGAFGTAAESVADQTGLTVLSAFAARDVAAGGAGTPITPLADYLLARDLSESRLLLHLGAVTSLVLLPARVKTGEILAFDCGPGNRFLDELVHHCTREKDRFDTGIRAVQGRADDDILQSWSRHPYLSRKPPKTISPTDFHEAFVAHCINDARKVGLELNDLLCTATHFVAGCLGAAVRHWLPATQHAIYLTGGGTRNGFLRQLLARQFPGESLRSGDEIGIPVLSRKACTAGLIAGLTLDGVTGNLPQLTGASGGRLIGRIVPGDVRNWAAVTAWAAEQMGDYTQLARAA